MKHPDDKKGFLFVGFRRWRVRRAVPLPSILYEPIPNSSFLGSLSLPASAPSSLGAVCYYP